MPFTGLQDRTSFLFKDTTSGELGPGSYNIDPAGKTFEHLKKRSKSQKPPAFGSGEEKQVSKVTNLKYTPGPGFYNAIKQKSSFTKEYMKSEEDEDLYYVI
jgi:hypothetical protein